MDTKKKYGLTWWTNLSSLEKENEVASLLDQGKTCDEIASGLGLETKNRVVTVRARIKQKRTALGISMVNWHTSRCVRMRASAVSRKRYIAPKGVGTARVQALNSTEFFPPPELEDTDKGDDPFMSELDLNTRSKRYGESTHLSSKQKHERGIADPDFALERSAAFPGTGDDCEAAIARYYESLTLQNK